MWRIGFHVFVGASLLAIDQGGRGETYREQARSYIICKGKYI